MIHAAKRRKVTELRALSEFQFSGVIGSFPWEDNLPFGALVAVANLVDCRPVDDIPYVFLHGLPYEEDLGNYEPGRYGWLLDDIRKLPKPIPYVGRQGLFSVPDHILVGQT